VGDKSIKITLEGTLATKDQYKEGYIFIDSPILGTSASPHELYKIRSHAAIDASGTGEFFIDEDDGFVTAITAGTETAGLIKNPYKDAIVAPGAIAGRFIGVTTRSMTATYFGWLQVAGMAAVACDTAAAIGTLLGASSNHAGQFLAVSGDTTPAIARVQGKATVDNKYHMVMLQNLY
jgi:hypothetical protein